MLRKCLLFLSALGLLLPFVGQAAQAPAPSKPKVIIMLGPPGAGKGTVAVKLADKMALPHISTGDLFRENLKKKTPLGNKAKGYMDKGQLVPDELVLEMLLSRVENDDCAKGYILDGFPRTLPQAEALTKKIEAKTDMIAIDLKVSDHLLVDRVVKRRACENCGAPFHLTFSPPKVEGECDRCGGALSQRSDDTEAVVTKRLAVYHEQTAPLVDYYSKQKKLVSINGEQSQSDVFNSVYSKVNN